MLTKLILAACLILSLILNVIFAVVVFSPTGVELVERSNEEIDKTFGERKIDEKCPISNDINPVCDRSGRVYDNPSEAYCYGVSDYSKRYCEGYEEVGEEKCVVESDEIDPVCDSEGNWYENPGHAKCAGVTEFSRENCQG